MELEKIKQLFSEETRLYCILDGVMVPDLPVRLTKGDVPHYCLLAGELEPELAHAAPYLVHLSPDSKFADWVLSEAVGKHWGIFLHSRRSMIELRRHFQALLQAYDERGNPIKFRFYDPRVFRKFLPTCNGGELRTLFGDTDAFFCEGETMDAIERYQLEGGKLQVVELE